MLPNSSLMDLWLLLLLGKLPALFSTQPGYVSRCLVPRAQHLPMRQEDEHGLRNLELRHVSLVLWGYLGGPEE